MSDVTSKVAVTLKGLGEGERPYVEIALQLEPNDEDVNRILAAVFGKEIPVLVRDSSCS